jgi:transcription initiation factor IIF auxiliary subunit
MTLATKVVADDNEDNAILALKIVFDLHKTFRTQMEAYVQV